MSKEKSDFNDIFTKIFLTLVEKRNKKEKRKKKKKKKKYLYSTKVFSMLLIITSFH